MPPDLPDVVELSATRALDLMGEGVLTSAALVDAYLDRIDRLDRPRPDGPSLGAVLEVAPDAREQAEARDRERAGGGPVGPLHGLPVIVKDNIDVAGLVCSAGSLALAGHRPTRDAFVVRRLRDAGAVVIGKANLSEWANFRSTASTSGWSSRGGQVRNPYALDRSPCGSSSGTAVAVSAGLATLGVGTETDGSIVCPSAFTAIVGVKPTVGLVSRDGIIPIAASQDTAGPMARSVADAALLLGVLAGADPADPASAGAPPPPDYLAGLAGASVSGRRLGVLRGAMGYHAGLDAVAEEAFELLRGLGAELVDVETPDWGAWGEAEVLVLRSEFRVGLEAYLARVESGPRTVAELVEWNAAHADTVLRHFGQEHLEAALTVPPPDGPEVAAARELLDRTAGRRGVLAALGDLGLDALIAPTASPPFPIDPVLGDHYLGSASSPAAVGGTPSVTVPMGWVHGLPVGMMLLGAPYDEARLLGLAHVLEGACGARRPPTFPPTIPT